MRDSYQEQIESERLIIRVPRSGDGAIANEAIIESFESLAPWLAWVTPPPDVATTEEGCRRARERFSNNEDLTVYFFLKETGELIGGSGLHDPNWELRHFEIGYWGRTRFSGTGLMTEGVKALAEHALSDLKATRVIITCDNLNIASWRLADRAGFQLEGILRNERLDAQGRLRDTRLYSRIPDLIVR